MSEIGGRKRGVLLKSVKDRVRICVASSLKGSHIEHLGCHPCPDSLLRRLSCREELKIPYGKYKGVLPLNALNFVPKRELVQ